MQLRLKNAHPSTTLLTPLLSTALVVSLSTFIGCAEEAELEDEVSPSPVSAVPAQQATRVQPPEPVEPPNPATHRPPMDNPGGLNRFRPARPVPGLD